MRFLLLLWLALLSAPAAAEERPMLRVAGAGHHAAIRALAHDARGELWLTVSEDKTARLWRGPGRQLQAVLRPPIGQGQEGKLFAGALSPDGRFAALAGWSAGNDVYLFRCADGQLLARIQGQPNVVNQLVFSADGRHLAVALWGRHGVQLWRSEGDWQRPKFAGADNDYADSSYGLAFSPDGRQLAASAHDGSLRLYALVPGGLQRQAVQALGGRLHGLQFSPDGQHLAVGHADLPQVQILRTEGLQIERTLRTGGSGGLSQVVWSPDGAELRAAGSWRQGVGRHGLVRWNRQGQAQSGPQLASDSVTELSQLPDGRLAFAAADARWGWLGPDGQLQAQGSARTDYRALEGASLRVSADGRQLHWSGWGAQAFEFPAFSWRSPAAGLRTAVQSRPGAQLRDWRDSAKPSLNGKALALEAGEVALSAAVDPQRPRVALGTAWKLRWLDLQGRELWQLDLSAPCFALALSADGRFVIAGLGDGTLRWIRARDGEPLLAFYNEGRAWVAWTPDGRYTAGEGGQALVGWHLNRGPDQAAEFLPLARFAERHDDPQAVFAALGGEASDRPVTDLRQGLQLPPSVQLLGPAPDSRLREASQALKLQAQDRGGGVDELRLYLNDKLVERLPARGLRRVGGALEAQWQVRLQPGENRLRALALASDRTESQAAELRLVYDAPPPRPSLHVLTVGVNRYRNAALNLSFSVPDARGVAALLRQTGAKLFDQVRVDELHDDQATKAGVLARLQALRQTREDDVVLVYLAGHGDTLKDDWYFVPHELTHPEQPERLAEGGLSSRELAEALRQMPARKVVVLIDACKSGAAAIGFRGLEERRVLAQLSRASGTHLIAATTKEQLASELGQLGHGVFTYALLEGLRGKAAAGGPEVTARKLMVYVEQALPELSLRYRAEEQFPVVNSTGMDFPLTLK